MSVMCLLYVTELAYIHNMLDMTRPNFQSQLTIWSTGYSTIRFLLSNRYKKLYTEKHGIDPFHGYTSIIE
jgi:hypothetical protein